MTIKETVKQTGLTEKTIRYYEEQGFIHPAMEMKNGRRFRSYTKKDADALRNIAVLRRMRFTIEEIKEMMQADGDIAGIVEIYRNRCDAEYESLMKIRQVADTIKIEELHSLQEIIDQAARCLDGTELPLEDREPDFGRIDRLERSRNDKLIRSICVWPKKKLFPVRMDMIQAVILQYLLEEGRSFTEICHYLMDRGIAKDSSYVSKIVTKMRRRKIISEKNHKFYPLIDAQSIQSMDVERMVQIASTGSGNLLMVYNWMPPMSVSSIPRS